MEMKADYEKLLRDRITQLRVKKNVSEHRMSLDLGKSGSYIRGITSGTALPSVKELFNIISYFDMSPAEFFNGMEMTASPRAAVIEQLLSLNESELVKVSQFISWITKE